LRRRFPPWPKDGHRAGAPTSASIFFEAARLRPHKDERQITMTSQFVQLFVINVIVEVAPEAGGK